MNWIFSLLRQPAPVPARFRNLRFGRFSAVATAACVAFPALSQAQPSTWLDGVLITASRVAQPVTQVIADVSLIDRHVIEQAGQSSLRDLLGQQAGVQFSSNGDYRSVTGVFLRGASTSQAIVLVDGVRLGSATSGGASFENIPLARIERIEILRGAASALYGPDAVGGVIQIFTRQGSDTFHLDVQAGVGSDGQRQASASVRGRAGRIGYSLGVSREQAQGINVIGLSSAGSYNPDRDGFASTSADLRLSAELSSAHALTLALLRSQSDYQFDGSAYPASARDTDAWARPTLNAASLKWDAQWLPHWKSSLLLARNDDDTVSDYYHQSTGALYSNSQFKTRRSQASWQNDVTLGQDVLTLLLESRSEEVSGTTAYTVKQRDIHSAMVSYALNQPHWNALAVLRRDDNSQFGSLNNWALSGGYRFAEHWRAVGSLGTSFQAPSFNQLYYPGFGNALLTPQRNRASEVGLKYQQGSLSGSAVLYHNDVKGFLDPATNQQSSRAVLRGVSLSLQNQVGDTRYAITFDHADPYAQPSQARLLRVARNVLNLSVNQRLGAVEVFGELKLSSDREDNNLTFTGRDVLAGYGLLNLGAQWQLDQNLRLQARLNNLGDTRYALANGYAMPGRNLLVTLAWAL